MNEELRQLRIENKILREEKKQALQDSEQYRLQMAGISTAAIGYWKEGDGIHPDYDTPALHDVAKLYAEYDELYKAQNVPHGVIAGALFDFMGWLTSRPKRIMLSSADEASPAVDAIKEFAKMRGLSLDDARVQDWQDSTTPPNVATPLAALAPDERSSAWVGLTDEEIDVIDQGMCGEREFAILFALTIEAELKAKNSP
jgi:hypothetical protein